VAASWQDEVDEGNEEGADGEGIEQAVRTEEHELDEPRPGDDEEREEQAARAGIRRRPGVRDHEEGEDEERSALQLVQGYGDRVPEPRGTAHEQQQVQREERVGDVAPARPVDDEAPEASDQEAEEGGAPPLGWGDPRPSREEQAREGDVRRIEEVLPAQPQDELAAHGEDGPESRDKGEVRPQQQAKRESRDEGAPWLEPAP